VPLPADPPTGIDLIRDADAAIDARVFQPMRLKEDWDNISVLFTWIPRFLFEYMVSLSRPPSPEEYFALLAEHFRELKKKWDRSLGSLGFDHVYVVSDIMKHEHDVVKRAQHTVEKHRFPTSLNASNAVQREIRHAEGVMRTITSISSPENTPGGMMRVGTESSSDP